MARVWAHSKHGGSHLLMLLAIADFADDDGRAYPAVNTLAEKTRMKPRNCQTILAALRQSGELEVRENEGPRGTNLYRIAIAEGVQRLAGVGMQESAGVQRLAGVQANAPGGAKACAEPLQRLAPEPSLNHQEPPDESASPTCADRDPRISRCPHSQILTMFGERVPHLPKPRAELWAGSEAAKNLAARWRWVLTAKRDGGQPYASTNEEALAWFGRFFDAVAASDFLTGRSGRWSGCSLQWLVKPRNFAKVVEGNYSREGATA